MKYQQPMDDSEADFIDFQVDGYLGNTNKKFRNSRMAQAHWYWQQAEQLKRRLEIERQQAINKLLKQRDTDIDTLHHQYQLTLEQEESLNPKGKYQEELQENRRQIEEEKRRWAQEELPKRLEQWKQKIGMKWWEYQTKIDHCEADIAKYKQDYEDA